MGPALIAALFGLLGAARTALRAALRAPGLGSAYGTLTRTSHGV